MLWTPLSRGLAFVTAIVAALSMAQPASASVPVPADGTWTSDASLQFPHGEVLVQMVSATNASGATLVAGYKVTYPTYQLWAVLYTPGQGWGPFAFINDTGATVSNPAAVALGDDGVGFVAWTSLVPSLAILAAKVTASGGWSAQVALSNLSEDAYGAVVAADSQGGGMVTWQEDTAGVSHIWASRNTGAGWGAPVRLDSDVTDQGEFPMIAASGGGSYIAFFHQATVPHSVVRMARFTTGSGWAAPVTVSTDATRDHVQAGIVAAADGSAFLAFRSNASGSVLYNLSVRDFTPFGGLGAVHVLDASSHVWGLAPMARDAGGNFTALWDELEGTTDGVYAARYAPASGWGTAAYLGPADASLWTTNLAAGDGGTATAVWKYQDTGGRTISFARYLPGKGWSAREAVEWVGDFDDTALGAQPGDRALLLVQHNGAARNYAFTFNDVQPPALSIASPAGGAVLTSASVLVQGTTEPGAAVRANGVAASVDSLGAFSVRVPLGFGNTIAVSATDAAGNTAWVTVNVSFNDPVVALQGQLDASRANETALNASLAATQASLNTTQAALTSTQAQLAAAQANETAQEASLAATQNSLSATQSSLNTTQSSLATTRADLATSQGNLASAQAGLSIAQAQLAASAANASLLSAQVASLRGNVSALEAKAGTGGTAPPPASGDMLALLLGAAGIAVGAVGVAMAMRAGRKVSKAGEAQTKGP